MRARSLRRQQPPAWLLVCASTLAGGLAFVGCSSSSGDEGLPRVQCDNPSTDLFEERVAPLLADDQPKTCNQCHLSGIDLSTIVRDDPCESMACMVQDGLVDLSAPEKSKILTWIDRAEPDSDLITEDVIGLEHDAFLQWIEEESECRSCASTPCSEQEDAPFCEPIATPPDAADISSAEDCSDKTLEQLFLDTIYASRGRCYPCHYSSNTTVKEAPKWISQDGTCEAASLATMRTVVKSGYVNVDDPSQSLLLLKPLAEADGGLEHGGHDKFQLEGDAAYQNFLSWLTYYSDCQKSGGE